MHAQSRKRGWNDAFDHFDPIRDSFQSLVEPSIGQSEPSPQPWKSASSPGLLNSSNSSDVACTEWDAEPGVCCFGTLYHVGVRFRRDPLVTIEPSTPIRPAPDGSSSYIFQIVLNDSVGEVVSTTGSCIAVLNSKIFAALNDSKGLQSLQFEGLIFIELLQSLADPSGRIPAGLVTNVNINIYGKSEEAAQMARDLSRHGFYLQDPVSLAQQAVYHNPQLLELPEQAYGSNGTDAHHSTFLYTESNNDGSAKISDDTEAASNVLVDYGDNFDLLIDEFAQHDYLSQASVDMRIRTLLLAHQREGLDFLLRRETLSTHESRSLWQLGDSQDEDPSQRTYSHLITGARCTNPEDSRGGILADDMGLGKSLMMISAIVATTTAAFQYAVRHTTPPIGSTQAVVAAKTTLVVVPSALLIDNWIGEINKHTNPYTLSYYKYHGQNRTMPLSELLSHDIILTTYGTIAAEYKRKRSVLFEVKWYRTVLDEAHMIRNATTIQFRGVSSIKSLIRWCLSGTPIQNSLDDLGSLVAFLGTPILKEAAQYRRHISHPICRAANSQRPNFNNLRLLLSSLCLRRNKSILPIFQPVEHVRRVVLSASERHSYHQLGWAWRQKIALAVSGHKPKEAHQTVLEALLRMRIYCNNGDYFSKTQNYAWTEADELGSLLQQEGRATCYACSCDVLSFGGVAGNGSAIITSCHRAVCSDCVEVYLTESRRLGSCLVCKAQHATLEQASGLASEPAQVRGHDFPSKCKMLCEDILQHRSKSKSIVFSFWRKSLDIIGAALEHSDISFLRVDGTTPFGHRKRILSQFHTAGQGTVLLLTLGTGAIGLNNLTVADRVHILEPQWNPSVESQAIGRVARLGQTREVHVLRYIVDDTVEENVQNGQLRKLQLAKGGFGGDKAANVRHKVLALKDLICPDTV